jgi:uncharacterized repeat protein (TIGR03803 family)
MRNRKSCAGVIAALAILALTPFLTAARTIAQTETLLHNFGATTNDGVSPNGVLILNSSGNLFGTTYFGGPYGVGTVFEVSPKSGGGWTTTLLHVFGKGTDGQLPNAGLLLDSFGNLYGTTTVGGTHNSGIVFELIPATGGKWTERVLHNFNSNGVDGVNPYGSSVVSDASGNLFGTTSQGGAHSQGTVFELSPKTGGGYSEKILYSFNNNGTDGYDPASGVTLDAAGNLYGTTAAGGPNNSGAVFTLTASSTGYTEQILHSFNLNDSFTYNPVGGLVLDIFGNLYGTTTQGGEYGGGGVFELTPSSGGTWTMALLHLFGNLQAGDGSVPFASVIFDATGNLYGTTANGGAHNLGTVFKLTPAGGGVWNETLLHSFSGSPTDGSTPYVGLVLDATGNLYGVTHNGGRKSKGTVFEIVP